MNVKDQPQKLAVVPEDATDVKETQLYVEEGDTGTILINGILSNNDYNADLTGTQRIRIFDEMRLGDATVRAALQAVKLPILSAEWYIKPANKDDKTALEQKTFIENQLLKNPSFSWNQFLRQALTLCDYGNSIFEKVFKVIEDGDDAGKIGWEKFGHRLSKTITRWTMEDKNTPGITQLLPSGKVGEDGKTKTLISIPKWKLLYFINDIEGSNMEGISLLRPAYKHWYMKDTYYKIDAIASERQGLGIPIISSPPQAKTEDKQKARLIAKNIRANSQLFADLPQGFKLEFADMKANTIKDVKDMVAHHDRQITKAVLAEFLELGAASSSGSYSLSDTQAELFYLGLQYLAKLIQEEMQKAINELVDLNWGQQEQYPTLEFGGIGKIDYESLAKSIQQLKQAGAITPDQELERYLRQAMKLPEAVFLVESESGEDVDKDGVVAENPYDIAREMQKATLDKMKNPDPVIVDPSGKDDVVPPAKAKPNGVDKSKQKPLQASEDAVTDFLEDAEDLLEAVRGTIHAKESNKS